MKASDSPAYELVLGHQYQHMYSRPHQHSAANHVRIASLKFGSAFRLLMTILPSHLWAAATSAAQKLQLHHESAGAAQESQLESQSPLDFLRKDGQHEDRFCGSVVK